MPLRRQVRSQGRSFERWAEGCMMKIRVNVITDNDLPGSRAFNCPLLATYELFREFGYELKFAFSPESWWLGEAECLMINSNVFRQDWKTDKERIFRFLEKAACGGKTKIFWFDTSESAMSNQFEVLPYVDCFLKSQLLIDKSLYMGKFKTGTVFGDFFKMLYGTEGDEEPDLAPPDPSQLHKLGVSWNICFENYSESRYGLGSRIRQELRRFSALPLPLQESLDIEFSEIAIERPVNVSCRIWTALGKPAFKAHRNAIAEAMLPLKAPSERIPTESYFEELRSSKIAVGAFGPGEITIRDFEIILSGAALLKPDLSHLETWPEIFQEGKTFLAYKWDLSDLREKAESLLENHSLRTSLAWEAQETYRRALSPHGLGIFVGRVVCALESRL